MKVFVFAGMLVLFLTVQTLAQSDSLSNNVFGGYLIMPIEFPVININHLNRELQANSLPKAEYPPAAIGIGLQLYTNRFIATFSFNKTTHQDFTDTDLTEVEYRSTALNIGYNLTKSYWYSVYPYIGLKGSGLNYLFRERIRNSASFTHYLQTNLRYKEISSSRGHLDLGLGFSQQWFYLVNFRFGYLVPIDKMRWKMNNAQTDLLGSPPIKFKYYFTLMIGLGNIYSEEDVRKKEAMRRQNLQ